MRAIRLFALLIWAPLLAHGAAVATYEPTRDTFMRGLEGGDQQLHGDATNGRASKSFLDFYIADFNRAAINSFIQTELGRPLTFDDMDDVQISLNVFSNDFQGYEPTALSRPAVFQGMRDWVEGTSLTPGATKNFAVYDPALPGNSLRWTNIAGAEVQWFLNLDKIENANFEEWGGQPFSFREWVLDDNVAFAFLTDPSSLGLFLNASDAGNVGNIEAQYSNAEIYSREAVDPSIRPFLKVDVVPEAGSSLLLGIGALLVVLRKRRQVG